MPCFSIFEKSPRRTAALLLLCLMGLVLGTAGAEPPGPPAADCAREAALSEECPETSDHSKPAPRRITERYPDGALKSETPVDDFGLLHGLSREYHTTGTLKAERTYRHGTLHGPTRLYYPEGILKTEFHYKNGLRHGLSIGYYRDGAIKDKGLYQEDKLEGRVFLYYPGGKIKAEMTFANDVPEGRSKTYYQSGGIKNLLVYEKGRLLKMETYNIQGERLRVQEFPR